MPKASWDYERSYAMRLMGKSWEAIGNNKEAYSWYMKSCAEAPNTREGWLDLAQYCYRKESWLECYSAIKKCLAITDRQYVYTSDPKSWTELPYDIGSIAAWKLGLLDESVLLIKNAIRYNPTDERLHSNLKLILDYENG